MGDELEKFIVRNRAEFDNEVPNERVWNKIQSGIRSERRWAGWWKIAALIFLMSTVYLLVERKMDLRSDTGQREIAVTDFTEAESYYTKLIAEKKAQMGQYDQVQLEREFLMEIGHLDQMYNDLKETYKNQNSTDLLVDAMIRNLKLRIDILDQQILILKRLKEAENESESNIEI